ncbi:MAG TPA: Minf_1886 family protein [Opitutaceae bacterium]
MEEPEFGDVVELIRKEDPRYDRRAYVFLRDALDHTVKVVRRAESKSGKKRGSNHVTGPELLEGIRDYAVGQFGPMTHFVLKQWGINRCSDFGEMVYQLIEYGIFSKTENDRKEDFSEVYDFGEAFVKPFLPLRRRNLVSEVANSETF